MTCYSARFATGTVRCALLPLLSHPPPSPSPHTSLEFLAFGRLPKALTMSRPPLGERAPRAGGSKAGSKAGGAGEGGGERGPQIDRPEVHFVGEIVSGCGFGPGVSCRWRVVFGESWELMGADASRFGQTHWDYPTNDEGDVCAWGHPLDLHLQTTNVEQGWPRLILKVMKMDDWERIEVVAYGQASLPTTSGSHRIEVNTWRPMGSDFEEAQGALRRERAHE